MIEYKLEIDRDTSGVTYGYSIYKNGDLYMVGDDYESVGELRKELREMRYIYNSIDIEGVNQV